MLHAPTVLLPLSFLLTYEAGLALFRSRWAGVATAVVQFALLGLAPGHGGAYTSLALPATASRALLLPALLALVFAYVRDPSWPLVASIAAASTAMSLVHPSHSVLVAVGLVGFLLVRAILDVRHDVPHIGAALAAILVPAGLVVLWLLPVVRETVSHNPSHAEVRRAFANYGLQLDVFGLHSYRLAPELFGRAGAIAVASLALVPLALFAYRRMWGAFVLGAMLVDLRGRPAAVRLPALRRCGLDLAGPPDRGLRAEGLRPRRRGARARRIAALGGAAGRARRRDCAPALVSRRFRAALQA